MFNFRRFLTCALLLSLAPLAGCELFSSDAWQRPSPLSSTPPPRAGQEKHEIQAGFSVLLDDPGRPAPARVIADIGTFARQHGFVRQSARPAPPVDPATQQPLPAAPERYILGNIVLDVAYRPADYHVVASLHSFSSQLSRKFADQFFQNFDREYGGRYGDGDPIFENDYVDESALFYRQGNGGARAGGGH